MTSTAFLPCSPYAIFLLSWARLGYYLNPTRSTAVIDDVMARVREATGVA